MNLLPANEGGILRSIGATVAGSVRLYFAPLRASRGSPTLPAEQHHASFSGSLTDTFLGAARLYFLPLVRLWSSSGTILCFALLVGILGVATATPYLAATDAPVLTALLTAVGFLVFLLLCSGYGLALTQTFALRQAQQEQQTGLLALLETLRSQEQILARPPSPLEQMEAISEDELNRNRQMLQYFKERVDHLVAHPNDELADQISLGSLALVQFAFRHVALPKDQRAIRLQETLHVLHHSHQSLQNSLSRLPRVGTAAKRVQGATATVLAFVEGDLGPFKLFLHDAVLEQSRELQVNS